MSKHHICTGLLAHVDAGKTTLSEGLLYVSGARRTLGRVDHRDAFLDTNSQERERGITIFSKQAMLSTPALDVTLVDTPGHVDFYLRLRGAGHQRYRRCPGSHADPVESAGKV